VCPEHITITDNAIIPLKERVVDDAYDPLAKLLRKLTGGGRKELPVVPAEPAPRQVSRPGAPVASQRSQTREK
jgi:hypothetical protein